ncbi:MAG: VOC family protein [Vicinamibacterales bacterium]
MVRLSAFPLGGLAVAALVLIPSRVDVDAIAHERIIVSQSPPVSAQVNPFLDFGIVANNAFFYYADLGRATTFYTRTLGVELVADYGYAKILRIAESSFLTLVDATKGMHTADEPKTTALALVTDELDGWHAQMVASGVPLRGSFTPTAGRPHDGFVAVDPEGYFLEFERFNPHEENARLMPALAVLRTYPAHPAGLAAGTTLGFKATVVWTYYEDLAGAQRFYEGTLGVAIAVDQGWAKIYQTSRSGFVGLVDGARGMHAATPTQGVTVSFFTHALDRWFRAIAAGGSMRLRSSQVVEDPEHRYRAFVGYDPGGYYLEFDDFLPHAQNTRLLAAIGTSGAR